MPSTFVFPLLFFRLLGEIIHRLFLSRGCLKERWNWQVVDDNGLAHNEIKQGCEWARYGWGRRTFIFLYELISLSKFITSWASKEQTLDDLNSFLNHTFIAIFVPIWRQWIQSICEILKPFRSDVKPEWFILGYLQGTFLEKFIILQQFFNQRENSENSYFTVHYKNIIHRT